jgi:hypothetical protein
LSRCSPVLADRPWLSVLMPVHEGAGWLDQTLASLACQDCSGIEILILDSSREPACRAIAHRYKDLAICYQHLPDVTSWTRKTNMAAELARAPHLAMLHQDDLWLPGRAASLKAALASDTDAVMWLSPAHIVDGNGKRLGLWRCPLLPGVIGRDLWFERLLVQNFVAIPAPVFRRDAWIAVGGLDETLWYTPDWDLYLKLSGIGLVAYCSEASTAFRIHAGSLTVTGSRNQVDFAAQMTTVIDRHIGKIALQRRRSILKTARFSVIVNQSLAAAAATGSVMELAKAGAASLRLTPLQLFRYLRDSRIAERLWPRLRARFAGVF